MKSLSKIMIIIAVLLSTQMFAQITKVEIVATGLTCSMCSNAINKQLKKLPEVEKVNIDLNTNTFSVYLKSSNKITPKTLKESVEKAGFFVGSMIVNIDFNKQKIDDNIAVTANNIDFIFLDTDKKILHGPTELKILDKGFVTAKEFKKLSKIYAKYASYEQSNSKNYHVQILK